MMNLLVYDPIDVNKAAGNSKVQRENSSHVNTCFLFEFKVKFKFNICLYQITSTPTNNEEKRKEKFDK